MSDELHRRLTQRFIDKRIVILNKTLKEHNNLEAVIRLDGTVFVEGEEVGTLNGFDFIPSLSQGEKAGPILTAARKILPREIERRVRELLMSDNAAFKFNNDASILWQNNKVATLLNSEDIYSPKININNYINEVFADDTFIITKLEYVGAQVGSELRDKGEWAMLIALFSILIYVALRFELIYGLGAYGFKNMKAWMWPWAALYAAQVAIAMFVWSVLNEKGGGLLPAVIVGMLFLIPTVALWRKKERFGGIVKTS